MSNYDETSSIAPNVRRRDSLQSPVDSREPSALHDILSGGLAGMVSIVAGQPFDTIKVRLQTDPAMTSSVGVIKAAMKSPEGAVKSLFAGMMPPLATATAVNAIVFSVYGYTSRQADLYCDALRERHGDIAATYGDEPVTTNYMERVMLRGGDEYNIYKNFMCGSIAGLVQCVVITPTEHVKCRLQTPEGAKLGGPLAATKSILRKSGMSGLFRGWWVTCLREVPSFGVYFSFYDYCRDSMVSQFPLLPLWFSSVVSGGLSGAATWACVYPIDIVKTNIQCMPIDTPVKDRRMIVVAKDLIRKHGVGHLFRGLGVTMLRAFPVNGMIFPVYELSVYCCVTPYEEWTGPF
jgi:solute carrier family 25 carnitine/acylcarnitine transporter 20/29